MAGFHDDMPASHPIRRRSKAFKARIDRMIAEVEYIGRRLDWDNGVDHEMNNSLDDAIRTLMVLSDVLDRD